MTMLFDHLARLITAMLVCLWGTADHQLEERRVHHHQFTLSAERGNPSLIVDNVFGAIEIETHDGPDVIVEIAETIYADSHGDLARAKEEVVLDIGEEPGLLRFYVDGPFRIEQGGRYWRDQPGYQVHYGFKIRMPRRTDIDVKTVSGGHIRITGIDGSFKVHNVNGYIDMRHIAGSGSVRTVNGQVSVDFEAVPTAACQFGTINGNIELQFPDTPHGDYGLKTFNGRLLTDFEFDYLPPEPVRRSEKGGLPRYKSDGKTRVRIGDGGPAYDMETLNGDILIKLRD